MKSILIAMIGFLGLGLSSASFADCGEGIACSNPPPPFSCGTGPGRTCDCTDPACRQNNPCLSASRCCQAFGNIGSIEGFPND